MGHASFWDNPDAKDDTPVIRHAPDGDQYHLPDGRMMERMPGSKVGRFAIVPEANADGTSKGFDGDTAGIVHVDPDAPDGGAIVDCSQLTKQAVARTMATSRYPHEVFYKLSNVDRRPQRRGYSDAFDPREQTSRTNSMLPPGAYVAPRANQDGTQYPIFNYAQEEPRPMSQQLPPPPPLANPYPQSAPLPGTTPAYPQQQQPPQQQLAPPPMPQQQYAPPQAPPTQQGFAPPPPQGYGPPPQQPYYYPPAQPQYQPMQPPPPDPQMLQMMNQFSQGLQAVMGEVRQMKRATEVQLDDVPAPKLRTLPVEGNNRDRDMEPVQTGVPVSRKRPVAQTESEEDFAEENAPTLPPVKDNSLVRKTKAAQQTVSEFKRSQREPEQVITGFETLEMPFINGPIGQKAKYKVYFEFPGLGKHSANYHEVVESDHCIALIYDTRYQEGTQYLPPDSGDSEFKLHVPHMKKTFRVASMGFNYATGVLDQIVLVKNGVEDGEVDG